MFINFCIKKIFSKFRTDNRILPRTIYKLVFLFLIAHTSIFAQKTATPESSTSGFKIEHFGIMDASEDHYEMAIWGSDEEELCNIIKEFDKDRNFKVKLSGIKTEIYKSSLFTGVDPRFQGFIFNAFDTIPPNANTKLELFLSKNGKEKKIDEMIVNIPHTSGTEKQPSIARLKPSGGVVGDTIVIVGKNLGRDIDKIDIYLHDPSLDEKKAAEVDTPEKEVTENKNFFQKIFSALQSFFQSLSSSIQSFFQAEEKIAEKKVKTCLEYPVKDETKPSQYNTMITKLSPATLSQPDAKTGLQELSFSIPENMDQFANRNFIRRNLKLRINVNGRNSHFASLTLLPENWNIKIILFTLLMTICTIGTVAWILGKWNILPNILLDVETNTYSLSRFQAFAWTVVLLGSYFYIAICTGLVLRDGVIPDFNPSLIGLMSISYTGLISSHFLGKKNPKNEIKGQPPELSNLFATNGNIDISRLQLLCFTIVAIAVYLYNLIISNTLNGLPDIPPTLHGLLLTSQGSYIGSKVFGDKIAVNRIFPNVFSITEKEIEFNMVGGGFVEGIKVMLEGSDKPPVTATYSSPSSISCKLLSDKIAGKKNLILIPPVGASITLIGVLEILEKENSDTVEIEPEKKEAESKSKKKSKA
jgi:hypothetical protein